MAEAAASKLISRINISLTGVANPFTPTQFARLQEIKGLLQNPLYSGAGGLDLLRRFDRRTFNEYNKLSRSFSNATTRRDALPGFFVIQRSVTRGL